ncbi:hypothetical protein SAMN05446635_0670 [Burkholderia sp. OK233]|nr:hypothetical protein SAMN05446635_0670 [Burkholderia sp. OK233]
MCYTLFDHLSPTMTNRQTQGDPLNRDIGLPGNPTNSAITHEEISVPPQFLTLVLCFFVVVLPVIFGIGGLP